MASKKLTRGQIDTLFSNLQALNPEPQTELLYNSPFQLLAAVLLSAQTTDIAVNKCTPALFARAPDATAMARLGARSIIPYIRSIGLFNSKAKNLAATAQILARDYAGRVPNNRKMLESLPGVGRKTANVLLNQLYAEPTIAVDTHVFRVANRTGLAPGKTPLEVEHNLLVRVPATYARHAHHWLILLGRYTCLARQPKCSTCPVAACCNFREKK